MLGRQGAGKGTQCVRLSRHYVVPHISTGDMLRAAVPRGHRLRPQGQGVHGRRRARARRHHDRHRRRAARPGRHDRAGASSSTASPARSARPRPWRDHRGRGRSTWSSTSRCPTDVVLERLASRRVCVDCGTNYSVDDAAEVRLDVRQLRRRGRPARGRHRGGHPRAPRPYERETAPLIAGTATAGCSRSSTGSGTHRRGDRAAARASIDRRRVELTRSEPSRSRSAARRRARARCAGPAGSWPRCTTRIRDARCGPGVTTADLDRIGRDVLDARGAHARTSSATTATRR